MPGTWSSRHKQYRPATRVFKILAWILLAPVEVGVTGGTITDFRIPEHRHVCGYAGEGAPDGISGVHSVPG